MEQSSLEKAQVEDGRQRFWRKVRNYSNLKQLSSSQWGSNMLKQCVPIYADAIAGWVAENKNKKAASYVDVIGVLSAQEIGIASLSFLAASQIINSVSQGDSLSSCAISIANSIELESLCVQLKKQMGSVDWRYFKTKINTNNFAQKQRDEEFKLLVRNTLNNASFEWSIKQKTRIGIVLVYLFKGSTGIIDFVNLRSGNNKMKTFVTVSDEAKQWIEKFTEHHEILRPVRYPMLVPPDSWEEKSLYSGGYKDPKIKLPIIKSHNSLHKSVAFFHDMPQVVSALNSMQAVPWRINKKVLGIVETYFTERRSINEILPFHGLLEMPQRPHDIDTNELARKQWRRKAQAVYQLNHKNKSKFLLIAKILQTARQFADEQHLYFPCQLDFRGRMYYSTEAVHPQGNDLSRGLLEFAEGMPINTEEDARWLMISGANKFGVDKVSFNERVLWVAANEAGILRTADDPLSNDWWTEADKPWQFLAWCFEYAAFKQHGLGYVSNFPCGLDGTNNGIQILSLLTKDSKTAKLTNVLPSESPQDIYEVVRLRVIELLEQARNKGNGIATKLLASGLVRRSVIKVPVMALPYGIRPQGAMEAIDSELRKISYNEPDTYRHLPENLHRTAALYLAGVIRQAVGQLLEQPIACMEWLKEASRAVASKGQHVWWVTPSGFKVYSAYTTARQIEVSTRLDKHLIDFRGVLEETNKVNDKATVRSISANFVHSMDASVAHLVSNKAASEGISFGVIHDCYVTHASTLARLAEIVRQTYVSIYSVNQLEIFRQHLLCQLTEKEDIKVLEISDFAVDELLNSSYFLS